MYDTVVYVCVCACVRVSMPANNCSCSSLALCLLWLHWEVPSSHTQTWLYAGGGAGAGHPLPVFTLNHFLSIIFFLFIVTSCVTKHRNKSNCTKSKKHPTTSPQLHSHTSLWPTVSHCSSHCIHTCSGTIFKTCSSRKDQLDVHTTEVPIPIY